MLITKREEVTKQGFCKILWRKLHPRGSLSLEFIHSSGWGGGERLFEFDWEEEGVSAYSNKYGILKHWIFHYQAAFASIETLTLAHFLLESSLLDSRFITYKASHMAASCLYLALLMNNNCTEWTSTLVHYTGYTKDELRECVLQLNAMNAASPNENLMAVRNKYSHEVFHEVAAIPSLNTLTIQI